MSSPINQNFYPRQLRTIAIIQTVLGAWHIIASLISFLLGATITVLTLGLGFLTLLIPVVWLAMGIISVVAGIKGLNGKTSYGLSLFTAIGQMALLLLCDVIAFACGLTSLILLMRDEVKAHFR